MRLLGKSLCAAAFVASIALPQVPQERNVLILAGPAGAAGGSGVTVGMAPARPGPHRAMTGFVSNVFFEKTVTGSPYSAEGVTEYTRTLADGTLIRRTSNSLAYRDGEGRTRQEHSMEILGALPASSEPTKTITITDPVAKAVYILNTATKTANQMPFPGQDGKPLMWAERSDQTNKDGKREVIEKEIHIESRAGGFGGAFAARIGGGEFKSESLGKQTIEGMVAEGTRITRVIPVGQIGNDRPITIVTESWFSPDLQMVVASRATDPMNGDTSYRLTNINRTEPPANLFQVPPDYSLKSGPELNMMRRILTTPKPKP